LNARTASGDDFLAGDNNVPSMMEVSHIIDGDIGLQRVKTMILRNLVVTSNV